MKDASSIESNPSASPSAAPTGWLGKGWRAVRTGIYRSWLEIAYWTRLFFYTSKRFLRVESVLSLAAGAVFFIYLLSNDLMREPAAMMENLYLYITAVTVFLASGLLPKERDEQTLEILWSQPISRNMLVVLQISTLAIWCTLLSALWLYVYSVYNPLEESATGILICMGTTSFTVASITVLISTFTRQMIATALVGFLLMGIHFYWFRELGPIQLFPNSIEMAENQRGPSSFFTDPLFINRVTVVILVGFVMDYLFRRLKRTAEWFT